MCKPAISGKLKDSVRGKHINPQWAPDGKSLYFLSDQSGITDIYRKDLSSGEIFQVTNVYTGMSGITAASPAFSVARDSGRIAYSLYEDGNYSIFTIDSQEKLHGSPQIADFLKPDPAALPPRQESDGEVSSLLSNSIFGLVSQENFSVHPYKPKLKLDYIAPPQVAVGVDRFVTYGGGGKALFFSDILGYQTLSTMVQISSRLADSAGLVSYIYDKYRWNWGVAVQRIPYVTGGFSSGIGVVDGQPADIEQEYIYRQSNYQLSGLAIYPFNQVRRLEFAAGYQYIHFDQEVRTRAFSLIDGSQILDDKQDLPVPRNLSLGFAQADLVYDSSFFGATSPILGQRYRFEISPYVGTFSYFTFLADFRHYIMPVRPFTLAFRILHYGRYGANAEDPRLYPLFIGYEDLVRGYNTGSFSASEEDLFNRLLGSKVLLVNAELRFSPFPDIGNRQRLLWNPSY